DRARPSRALALGPRAPRAGVAQATRRKRGVSEQDLSGHWALSGVATGRRPDVCCAVSDCNPATSENHMNATLSSLRATVAMSAHDAGQATADDSPVLRAAIGLAEQIRAASEEIERGRRLPSGIAAAMKEAGVFGMAMPRAWGSPEVDPLTQLRVIEALA